MNIIVSGWPASGGSTLAMALALTVNYKYLYAGGLFKFLAEGVYGSGDGKNLAKFETELGKDWDAIWEDYAAWSMHEAEGILLEGKTSGFLIDGENLFKLMIIADEETRGERAHLDDREHAAEIIKQRDQIIRQRWVELFNIDVFDKTQIENHYTAIVDTSEMSIREELEIAIDAMRRSMKFEDSDFIQLTNQSVEVAELYEDQGKLGLKQKLNAENLEKTPQQILKEWNEHFADAVEKLPAEFKQVVQRYK